MSQTYVNQLKAHIGESVSLKICLSVGLLILLQAFPGCQSANINTKSSAQSFSTPEKTPEIADRDDSGETVTTMPILNEIVKYKKANPRASSQDLADLGNKLLPTFGFEFEIDLGGLVETALKSKNVKRMKKDGYDEEYIDLTVPLVTVTGKKTSIKVAAPTSESCCCGYTYTPIPVTQISPARITVVIDGRPVMVTRTKELPAVQEYILYEGVSSPQKIRSWEAPFETYPYGLSVDGNSVFFETDLKAILLEESSDGSLRFVTRDLPDIITEKVDLREQPAPKFGEILHKSGEFGLYKYVIGGKSYVLEFPYICT